MTHLYLIRHGSTDWNQQRRYQGHADPPLNEEGRRQAEEAGRRLAALLRDYDYPLAAVYTSDLQRAVSTAKIVLEVYRTTSVEARALRTSPSLLRPTPLLREIGFGAWEGLTYDEVYQRWGTLVEYWYRDPGAVTPPGGEPYRRFCRRIERAFRVINARHPEGAVVMVTHGGPIRHLVTISKGLSRHEAWGLHLEPGSVTHLR